MKKANAGPVFLGYCVYIVSCVLQIVDIQHNIDVKFLTILISTILECFFSSLVRDMFWQSMWKIPSASRNLPMKWRLLLCRRKFPLTSYLIFYTTYTCLMDTNVNMAKNMLMCLSDFLRVNTD